MFGLDPLESVVVVVIAVFLFVAPIVVIVMLVIALFRKHDRMKNTKDHRD